jgi:hypothetical protein
MKYKYYCYIERGREGTYKSITGGRRHSHFPKAAERLYE